MSGESNGVMGDSESRTSYIEFVRVFELLYGLVDDYELGEEDDQGTDVLDAGEAGSC